MQFFQLKTSIFVLYFVLLSNLSIMRHEQESSNDHETDHLTPSKPGPAGTLCIKLKIPNNNSNTNVFLQEGEEVERSIDNSRSTNLILQEGEEAERTIDNSRSTNVVRQGEKAERQIDKSRNGYRICDICGKEFSSGKAWGGHKRHHIKIMKDQVLKLKGPAQSIDKVGVTERCNTIKAGDVKIKEGKPICCLCGKGFSSMNALFGHMKFHSDRDWKGTQPPSPAELDTVNCVELSSSLPSWRKRDKRGKETSSDKENSCDPDVYEAAMTLMILFQDTRAMTQPLELVQAHKLKDLKINESDEDDKGFLRQEFAKKMKKKAKKKKSIAMLRAEDNDDELIRPGGFKCNACGSSYSTFQALGGHRTLCTGKKPEESSQGSDDYQEKNQLVPSNGSNLFQCDICNKSFSTGQALGGHKRIHWKPIPVKTQLVPIKREHGYDDNDGYNCKLGFDLNEPYVLQDDE